MINNVARLREARKMFQAAIDEDRQTLVIYRKPMRINDTGDSVLDDMAEPVPHVIKCRICDGKSVPSMSGVSQVGLSDNTVKYILVNHRTIIYENDLIEADGIPMRLCTIEMLSNHGGIIGYQAKLIEAVRKEAES